jgi:hypothetical protein
MRTWQTAGRFNGQGTHFLRLLLSFDGCAASTLLAPGEEEGWSCLTFDRLRFGGMSDDVDEVVEIGECFLASVVKGTIRSISQRLVFASLYPHCSVSMLPLCVTRLMQVAMQAETDGGLVDVTCHFLQIPL